MCTIRIHDLAQSRELDAAAMATVRGGANTWLQGLGPAANVNVNVGVNQNLVQFQNVEVNALNNVGVIGASFGPLRLNVSPTQAGALPVVF